MFTNLTHVDKHVSTYIVNSFKFSVTKFTRPFCHFPFFDLAFVGGAMGRTATPHEPFLHVLLGPLEVLEPRTTHVAPRLKDNCSFHANRVVCNPSVRGHLLRRATVPTFRTLNFTFNPCYPLPVATTVSPDLPRGHLVQSGEPVLVEEEVPPFTFISALNIHELSREVQHNRQIPKKNP